MQPLDDYSNLIPFIDEWESGQAQFLGTLLYDVLEPYSVIDWGCASGLYLLPFLRHNCTIMGIDASPGSGWMLNKHEFTFADIRSPIALDRAYELALCIEVGEHLQPEYADILVDNVASNSVVIFWSAASPGQGGEHHYNEQPPEYWTEKFAKHGFDLHPQNDFVREQIADNLECQKVKWLLNNARLLVRDIH